MHGREPVVMEINKFLNFQTTYVQQGITNNHAK